MSSSSRVGWVLAAMAALLLGGPLGAAVVLAAVITPAVTEQQRLDCATALTVSGQWRPPFQQAYTRTSPFGMRFHPTKHVWKLHSGTDLASLPAPGPVVAAAAGTVTVAGFRGGYGNAVDIDHGGGLTSRYAHLARINPAIRPNAPVAVGQELGTEGATGTADGNHLHFEILRNGTPLDPVPFMAKHGAPLDGRAVAPAASNSNTLPPDVEGGIGFALPRAGTPRLNSLATAPASIPAPIKSLYVAAGKKYQLPWTLLAGIGMEETAHGRTNATSTAGAQGLMQFMPATFAAYGVDGNGDGRTSITNDADSIFTAANYLTKSGVTKGETGVRAALFAYNHATWYVNDVLHYAHAYGGVLGDPTSCIGAEANPSSPPLPTDQVAAVLTWAGQQAGKPYVYGANGPHTWDCSSFTQAAYRRAGLNLPRTAGAQRDWLAAGHGTRIPPERERPGDLIFWDSYLGPNAIGHVVIVADPKARTTIEAKNPRDGVGSFTYTRTGHTILEIWRPSAPTGGPA